MTSDFIKFPSTPHLSTIGSISIRDDKLLTTRQRDEFLSHELVVEEKIDGANLGISFAHDCDMVLQNRGSILSIPFVGQWKKLEEWIASRKHSLLKILGSSLILFGEWCYAKHSIRYTRLPDWFLGFDIFDRESGMFLSTRRRDRLLDEMNIVPVPNIASGLFNFNEILTLLGQSKFTDELAEGIYLRFDNAEFLERRAKLVRPEFVQNIDVHWSKSEVIPNQLHRSDSLAVFPR